MTTADLRLLTGQTLGFTGDPFAGPAEAAARIERQGAVLIGGGRILESGPAEALRARHPAVPVTDHGQALISAGFIDAHAHYPQTGIIASWGLRLIDWLNRYTFPEEARFGDAGHAGRVAECWLDLILANGTTTAASYCTIHPESVEAVFGGALARGMRLVAGRTCMDRDTAPANLRDTATSAYDQSQALIGRWHGQGRLTYAISPRFSPTSTEAQLEALGALWRENPGCLMQTHLSEQKDEVEWVLGLYPGARDYLDTYEAHGLIGPGALFGHAIHLTARERARLAETGSSLIHCPTSNAFIGSGLFDMALAQSCRVGLATDTGGGSSFSMLRTMAAAYEIAQLRGEVLHPAQLWWLATAGSARALRMEERIGNLAPGIEADLVVIDLASTPAIAQRAARAGDFWELLFPTIIMGDDRAVTEVYVAGKPMKSASARS